MLYTHITNESIINVYNCNQCLTVMTTQMVIHCDTDTDAVSCSLTSQLAGGAHNHQSKGVDAAPTGAAALGGSLTKSEHN